MGTIKKVKSIKIIDSGEVVYTGKPWPVRYPPLWGGHLNYVKNYRDYEKLILDTALSKVHKDKFLSLVKSFSKNVKIEWEE